MSPPQDALAFGRPGCGAPQRTKSGRIRTAIFGNPEIRFQANESVKKTINNNIRYPLYLLWSLVRAVNEMLSKTIFGDGLYL